LEKVISFARDNQYIFLAQSVWWISSILGIQEGLIIHINNLKKRHQKSDSSTKNSDSDCSDSGHESISTTETDIHDPIIDNCEFLLEQSKQERKAVSRFNRQASGVVKKKPIKTFRTQTEGIDGNELQCRKAAGECQCCAWPQDRKGSHKTLDCFQWKRLEKGTAPLTMKQENRLRAIPKDTLATYPEARK